MIITAPTTARQEAEAERLYPEVIAQKLRDVTTDPDQMEAYLPLDTGQRPVFECLARQIGNLDNAVKELSKLPWEACIALTGITTALNNLRRDLEAQLRPYIEAECAERAWEVAEEV